MKPLAVAGLMLVASVSAALYWAPSVNADCHCTYIGCGTADGSKALNGVNDTRDRNKDGKLSEAEMGPCDYVDPIIAKVHEVTNNTTAYFSFHADTVLAYSEGQVWLAPGQDVGVHVAFVTAEGFPEVRGNITFEDIDGLDVETLEPMWDTANDNTAEAVFHIDDDLDGAVNVPYTIEIEDGATVTDSLPLNIGMVTAGGIDLVSGDEVEVTVVDEDGPIPGLGVVAVLLALVGIALLARRRQT